MTSQRSTFIMRPSSETITVRNRSRLMARGSVMARRLMIPSRASCILILRSKDRDWALFDIVRTEHSRSTCEVQKLNPCSRAPYNPGMPIYEFECRKCKAHMEVFQKISDKPPVKCRKCGGRLERKISAPAIQFKGSGWYVTDYAGRATKGDKSESESSTETKSEKSEKADTKTSSPAKKTSEKASAPKPSGD